MKACTDSYKILSCNVYVLYLIVNTLLPLCIIRPCLSPVQTIGRAIRTRSTRLALAYKEPYLIRARPALATSRHMGSLSSISRAMECRSLMLLRPAMLVTDLLLALHMGKTMANLKVISSSNSPMVRLKDSICRTRTLMSMSCYGSANACTVKALHHQAMDLLEEVRATAWLMPSIH